MTGGIFTRFGILLCQHRDEGISKDKSIRVVTPVCLVHVGCVTLAQRFEESHDSSVVSHKEHPDFSFLFVFFF